MGSPATEEIRVHPLKCSVPVFLGDNSTTVSCRVVPAAREVVSQCIFNWMKGALTSEMTFSSSLHRIFNLW